MRVQRTALATACEPASSRARVVAYLDEHGGAVESRDGRGLTRRLAEAIGYTDLSGLNALLTRLERDGVLTREVRGRRTFRIALVRDGNGGARPEPPSGHPSGSRGLDVGDPRGMLRACILLLVGERPSHGYDLIERLRRLGFEHDPSRIYRALRWLEDAGLVRPTWHTPHSGPARRVFDVTPAGAAALEGCARAMRARVDALSNYLAVHPWPVPTPGSGDAG